MKPAPTNRKRVAILGGCRTPFARAWSTLRQFSVTELAQLACAETLQRMEVPPKDIDQIILGTVLTDTYAPNIAREVVIACGWPSSIPGVTVSQACISSINAVTYGAQAIAWGDVHTIVAGGSESLSNLPMLFPKDGVDALIDAGRARSLGERLAHFTRLRPRHFFPKNPEVMERSTGLTMGAHAEMMAKIHGITREAQDDFAHESHRKAGEATKDGRLPQEITPVFLPPKFAKRADADNCLRYPSDRESMKKLKPVFDRKYGSVTAANSSPLTDGASAVVLMSEEKAKAEGRAIKGWIKSFAYSGLDPHPDLLLGPAYAIPLALDRAGLTLNEMDLVDMHEAFAAQVLCVLKVMGSKEFAQDRLNRPEAVGEIDPNKFNVTGGSIALGHPFGATGTRMIIQTLNELERRNGKYALLSLCAAGGMAAALILERP